MTAQILLGVSASLLQRATQADETHGSLQQAALEKMVRRKRYQFKVLAHHGSVRRNGNPFLQAANGLHVRFLPFVWSYRHHTYFNGSRQIPTYQGNKSLDPELGIPYMPLGCLPQPF